MATTQRKGLPYLYASWMAKRLAGETQCEWSLWFQSRYKYDKVQDGFDLAAWSAEHDALVGSRAKELEAAGYTVTTENANYFQLKGQTAIIAGKEDLIARKPGYCIVLDGKTGQQRNSDWHQVLIYAAVLPLIWHSGSMRISGEVFYKDGKRVQIDPEELTAERKQAIFSLAKQVGSATDPPKRTPSPNECRFCSIGKNDCPERMDDMAAAVSETSLF